MTDPKITIKELLEDNWGLGFTPKFLSLIHI